ncbi:MAG: nucleoside hydrolase, partial [Planctomycetia bacterium]|nr:nucleoside hydrolase [Planctomycetia bacterium]
DPRLEVLAVTAAGGNVRAEQATGNLQALVAYLDPPRLPRIGVAPTDVALPERPFTMHGADGLGGIDLPRAQLHGGHAADKVMWETIRAFPREVSIIALGPLTNLSRLLRRDPAIVEIIDRVVISGGVHGAAGSVTPVADLNFYCDPAAARHVIREPLTKSLMPLETSSQVMLEFDFLAQLPDESSRAGLLLRRMLPHTFRAHRQLLGSEVAWLHDVVALVAATNPELFERAAVVADVETAGELTAGMLVIDRRQIRQQRPNADVFSGCDAPAVKDCILRSLAAAATAT